MSEHSQGQWVAIREHCIPFAVSIALGIALGAATSGASNSNAKPAPGAYCPLPEKGQAPVCLAPAQAEYEDFFAGVESGDLSEDAAHAVELDLGSNEATERTYLALSSLSYGYYRLAELVARSPETDPALLPRLKRWNDLLLQVYEGAGADSPLGSAVREAALDLQRHTPAIGALCPAESPPDDCTSADGLVRALARLDQNAGVRSPLTRLMNRMVGARPAVDSVTLPAGNRP
jgi:hypothetical protein